MVKLNKLYTRTGDDGSTGLGDGSRRRKDDHRIQAMGDVDETNAAIGLAYRSVSPANAAILMRVQNELFDLGADLCMPDLTSEAPALRITAGQSMRLEQDIDAATAALTPLTSFILPGGSAGAAALHMARTIARRAERSVTALSAAEPVNPHALTYVNRLSDLLFALARLENEGGRADVLWVPGASR